jgi:hypothetical protein
LNGMKSAGDVFRGVDEKTLLTYISFTKWKPVICDEKWLSSISLVRCSDVAREAMLVDILSTLSIFLSMKKSWSRWLIRA